MKKIIFSLCFVALVSLHATSLNSMVGSFELKPQGIGPLWVALPEHPATITFSTERTLTLTFNAVMSDPSDPSVPTPAPTMSTQCEEISFTVTNNILIAENMKCLNQMTLGEGDGEIVLMENKRQQSIYIDLQGINDFATSFTAPVIVESWPLDHKDLEAAMNSAEKGFFSKRP